MPEVSCSRCGSTAAGLERAPLPGAIGEAVLAETCASCWREWLATQVKLINEQRLTPANGEHFELLVREMKVFLNLRDE
jgi:Fe-S cluster biosynthesis and repair protein YggX